MNEAALLEENKKLKEIVTQQAQANKELQEQVAKLSEQVRLLQILQFGPKSEKLDAQDKRQGRLFNEAEDTAFCQDDNQQQQTVTDTREVGPYTRRGKREGGRKALSEDLLREIETYDIEEDEKSCGCGHKKTCIGEDVSERLKIIPAKVVVIQERRKKYACRSCEGTYDDEVGVQRAEGPRRLTR